jgi:hypothetical protein
MLYIHVIEIHFLWYCAEHWLANELLTLNRSVFKSERHLLLQRTTNHYLKKHYTERINIDRLTYFIYATLACSKVLWYQLVLAFLELLNLHQVLQEVGRTVLNLVGYQHF